MEAEREHQRRKRALDRPDQETPSRRLYFAYGSNMDAEQMGKRCPRAVWLGKAALAGHRFIINSRTYATLISEPESCAEGILWLLTPTDEASLDRYEGVAKGFYRKEVLKVKSDSGSEALALVYLAAHTDPGKPRNDYIARILGAARYSGLSEDYIKFLQSFDSEKSS